MYRDQRSLIESGQESVYGKFDLLIKILKENCIDLISHFSQKVPRGALPLRTPQGETP